MGNCFSENYKLSDKHLKDKYHVESIEEIPGVGNKTIVQWGMFVEPRHPIFLTLLANIVDVVKHEYVKKSVLLPDVIDSKSGVVVCATGKPLHSNPAVLTLFVMIHRLGYAYNIGSDCLY